MNIFRIPLNFFVVLLLLKVKYLSSNIVFTICSIAHGISFACYFYFYSTLKKVTSTNIELTASEKDDTLLAKDKDETV